MTSAAPDWDARLRDAGLRSTEQRRAVLAALDVLGHATVDEIAARVQQDLPDLSLSTVYRTVERLDSAGLITHAHLHRGGPTYHRVEDDPHIHLVCQGCGAVEQQPASIVADLVRTVRAAAGFEVAVSHLVLHGRCRACAVGSPGEPPTLAST